MKTKILMEKTGDGLHRAILLKWGPLTTWTPKPNRFGWEVLEVVEAEHETSARVLIRKLARQHARGE